MKRYFVFLIIISLTIILASCSRSDDVKKKLIMDTDTFYEETTIPDRLSIDFNLDKIKKVEKATTYHADSQEFDEQKLVDAFIQHDVMERKIWAEGPQIIASAANVQEYLNIYDGGRAFGVDNESQGGFSYTRSIDDFNTDVFNIIADTSFAGSDFINESIQNSNYASYKDLDFLPYEDALIDITKMFQMAELPLLKVDETYSLDLKTMQTHYESYLHGNSDVVDEEYKNINWTQDHEAYIFSMQQLVNGIPIVNRVWNMPDGTKSAAWGNPMSTTNINLLYDKTGIREIGAVGIMHQLVEIEENELITIYEALHTLIEDYSLIILEDDVSIVSAELSYLNIPDGDITKLTPGWVFRSTKSTTVDNTIFTQYKVDVVNAVTGKLYQDRW